MDITAELQDAKNVLDGFSGSTRVAQAFAQSGLNTTANDTAVWSEVLANCYLIADKPDAFYTNILNHLNNLKGYEGWFTQNYGGTESESKKPFQIKNTKKLDAIREEIEKLNLSWPDKCVILTSLILALDAVDSTLGHYVSYLSSWSKRSYKDLYLQLPKRPQIKTKNSVLRKDIFETIKDKEFDLAYFDPPYGSNNEKMPPSRIRYNSYYHIWTTVINNDRPKLFGKANRRADSRDLVSPSVFEEFRKDGQGNFLALNALQKLIEQTKAKYILLSYNSNGRATKEQLQEILNANGKVIKTLQIDYKKNVMAAMKWTKDWAAQDSKNYEYLFLLKK